jgi:hypothetical protein
MAESSLVRKVCVSVTPGNPFFSQYYNFLKISVDNQWVLQYFLYIVKMLGCFSSSFVVSDSGMVSESSIGCGGEGCVCCLVQSSHGLYSKELKKITSNSVNIAIWAEFRTPRLPNTKAQSRPQSLTTTYF